MDFTEMSNQEIADCLQSFEEFTPAYRSALLEEAAERLLRNPEEVACRN